VDQSGYARIPAAATRLLVKLVQLINLIKLSKEDRLIFILETAQRG
jgi:hypothetical protein